MSAFVNAEESGKVKVKIAAKSGLVLRSEKSIKSKKLAVISYGTFISVNSNVNYHMVRVANKDGYWLKTSYNGKEGWVFSAYIDFDYNKPKVEAATFIRIITYDSGEYTITKIECRINGKKRTFDITETKLDWK